MTKSAPVVSTNKLILAVVVVAACAELAYTTVNISAMPVFIRAHKLNTMWIQMAALAFILMEGVLKSPFGVLGDRIGRRALIVTGPMVSIITCMLTPHIQNPPVLILLRVLDGIGAAALWPAAFSLIGDHVPEEHRSRAMSYFNLAYLVGIALGPLLGGGVNDFSYHHMGLSFVNSKSTSFYVASLLFGITTIVAMALVPKVKPVDHHTEAGEGGLDLGTFAGMLKKMPSTLLMTFTTFLGIGLIMTVVKDFCLHYFQFSETKFGTLLIGPALVIAALSVPLGTTGDKIGKANAVKIGISLCTLSFWVLMLAFNQITLVVFGSILGLGFVVAFPAWMALVSSITDSSQRGAAIGAVGTAQGLGAITGVAISSVLYKQVHVTLGGIAIPDGGLPFLACGLMLGISMLLALTTVKDPKRI